MVSAAGSTTIFQRLIDPESGSMSRELAQFILDLDFPPADHSRYGELSTIAQERQLTPQEADELDSYLQVDSWLAIMRLKAERSIENDRNRKP